MRLPLHRAVRLVLTLVAALALAGCGGGGGGAVSGVSSGAPSGSTAGLSSTVVLRFPDAPVVREAVTAYRVTGYNAGSPMLFGPSVFPSAPAIVLTLPNTVTSLFIEPMAGTRPTDAVVVQVRLDGSIVNIADPIHTGGKVQSLAVTPARPIVLVGTTQAFQAAGTFPDGSVHDLAQTVTWSATPPGTATVTAPGTVSTLAEGTVTVSATLDGVTGQATLVSGGTATGVTSSVSPSLFSQAVTLTATVTAVTGAAVSGAVTFLDGGTPLGTVSVSGGVATLRVVALGIGTHPVTATFDGGTDFPPSTSAVFTQVVDADLGGGHVGSSANPAVFGRSVTFTATVTAVPPSSGTPTGTVTFRDGATTLGSATLSAGEATFSTSALGAGSHAIRVAYGGDASFAPCTSSVLSQTVNQAVPTVTLATSDNGIPAGQAVTFTATVTPPDGGTPSGTVTFSEGAVEIGTGTVSGGIATLTTSSLAYGMHAITASYGGSADFEAASSAVLNMSIGAFYVTADAYIQQVLWDGTSTVYWTSPVVLTGLDADAAGNLYVGCGTGGVYRVDRSHAATFLGATEERIPYDVAVDATGTNVYASTGGRVLKSTGGAPFTRFTLSYAEGLFMDGLGLLYGTDPNGVFRIAADGSSTTLFNQAIGGLGDIVVDGAGTIYRTTGYDDRVYRISGGSATEVAPGAWSWPTGVTLAADGNVYVSNRRNSTVTCLHADGTTTVLADFGPIIRTWGIVYR